MDLLKKNKYALVLGIFALFTFLLSAFTNLHYDEAYYYMYSNHLSFGYFDHPPMIAFMIKLGNFLFNNEFGLRFITSIFSIASFGLLLYQFRNEKNIFYPALFILSFPLFHTHIAGIFAIPDSPLAFFTICFFLVYKKFLTKSTLGNSLLLALIVAAMFYSKYHAFIVIFFTVLSNLKLFKNKYFYIVLIVSAILFIPHVLWQFENDFPTLHYHLKDRNNPLFILNNLEFLGNQLLIAGPLTFFITLSLFFRHKAKNSFEKALVFNIWGFLIFFFIMSFRTKIEGHWTALIVPMLILLIYNDLKIVPKKFNLFLKLAKVSIVLIVIARFYLAFDFFPNIAGSKNAFYKWGETMETLKKEVGDDLVAFKGSYKLSSLYNFYNKENVTSLAQTWYRFSQYDYWKNDEYLAGKDFVSISGFKSSTKNVLAPNNKTYGFSNIRNYQAFTACKLEVVEHILQADSTIELRINITNNSDHDLLIDSNSIPRIGIMDGKYITQRIPLSKMYSDSLIQANKTIQILYKFKHLDTRQTKYLVTLQTHGTFRASSINFKLRKND